MLLLEHSAILLTCIKAIIGLENQFVIVLRVAVLQKFYCNISVRRHSDNSRGPTPTEENGLADSTNKPNESLSSISVVTHSGGRYVDAPPPSSRLRCRDFDGRFLSLD